MDLLAELEAMAINTTAAGDEVSATDAERWQRLLGYTHTEAIQRIEEYRNDYCRTRVPDELWATVSAGKEAEGYEREAYEYSLTLQARERAASTPASVSGTFVAQLTGPLDSPDKIREAASLSEAPVLTTGMGESGEARFCQIDGVTKTKLVASLAKHHSGFRPTFVRLKKAKKDLCSHVMAPALGLECTVPHHRPDDVCTPLPTQDQFPVWYFFYVTLADPAVLRSHLAMATEPSFVPATVESGRIRTWARKYKALVDAPGGRVSGSAFLVEFR